MIKALAAITLLLTAGQAGAMQGNWGYLEAVHTLEFAEDFSGDPPCRPAPGFMRNTLVRSLARVPDAPKILPDGNLSGDATIAAQVTLLYIPEAKACTGSVTLAFSRSAKVTFMNTNISTGGPVEIFSQHHVIITDGPNYTASVSKAVDDMIEAFITTWQTDNRASPRK